MKNRLQFYISLLLSLCITSTLASDVPDTYKKLFRDFPGVKKEQRTPPPPVKHKMFTLFNEHGLGKIELDQTTKEIVFTAPKRSNMHVKLFRDEVWENMGFSIVHTVKRYPYRYGVYKILIYKNEKYSVFYFREHKGKVRVNRLF